MFEMIQVFLSSFVQIMAWHALGLMLLGIAIGFMVGILPGLGGATTLALMLPFIVKMSPVEAFAFLLGMAAVTNTTGDITSILLGVPGEATTAATIVDGHPMAKRGEAGRALGAALMSSLIGAIFGAFALALSIPILRPLISIFRSPELFMLTILGLTFVASLSGEALLKGLITGGLGLLLATIGLGMISGVKRYTFGQMFLWDGIGLVPITIGMFALPEIIDLAVQGSSISGVRVGKIGGAWEGAKDAFRYFWMVIRCSAIGTYTSIIPGLGAATTQWLAYAHAVQSSSDKERFGKGAVEGVLGPGAANNSSLGGSLLTTIAFGIPASVSMAILMGAFLIHGIMPGPGMLVPEAKGGHLGLTFSFVWINVVSNILTVGICFLFLNQLAGITRIRGNLLTPFLLLLIYLGTFTEKNAPEDLLLLLIFGAVGYVMVKLRWPRPPLILGLVLGPLAEQRLFLSTDNYKLAFLWRPVVLIIIGLTLFGAIYPVIKAARKRKERSKQKTASPESVRHSPKIMFRLNGSTVFSLCMIAVPACALWEGRHFSFRAGLFPWTIGFSIFFLALAQFIKEIRGKEAGGDDEQTAERGAKLPLKLIRRRTVGIFGWIVAYFLGIWLLGFTIGVPVCTFLKLKLTDREGWPLSLILTAFTWIFLYGIFDQVLKTPFFMGKLFVWLGCS